MYELSSLYAATCRLGAQHARMMAYSVITKVHSCIDKRSTTYEHEEPRCRR
jgi:hypothetical protein